MPLVVSFSLAAVRREAVAELLDQDLGCVGDERAPLLLVNVREPLMLDLARLSAVPGVRLQRLGGGCHGL